MGGRDVRSYKSLESLDIASSFFLSSNTMQRESVTCFDEGLLPHESLTVVPPNCIPFNILRASGKKKTRDNQLIIRHMIKLLAQMAEFQASISALTSQKTEQIHSASQRVFSNALSHHTGQKHS